MHLENLDNGVCSDLDVIDQYLNLQDKFVIDAGCGNMHLSKAMAQRGAHVLAIDPDPVQAEKNNSANIINNVGFAQTGAESIPVESQSIDGVVFGYSLHHVPQSIFANVFDEVFRILKPEGFLFIMEPVAAGELNEVTRLFHDESAVRADAQSAIDTFAVPRFSGGQVIRYSRPVSYKSWEHFADYYAGKSFNTDYTESDVRADQVRQKFLQVGDPVKFSFKAPMQVTLLRNPIQLT